MQSQPGEGQHFHTGICPGEPPDLLAGGEVELLNNLPQMIAIVAPDRRLIFANRPFWKQFGPLKDDGGTLSFGRAVGCCYRSGSGCGCGDGSRCRQCVARRVIGRAMARERCTGEGLIHRPGAQAMEVRITVWPRRIKGEWCVVAAIEDLGDHHRRRMLERLFFHDALNSAASVRGLAEILQMEIEDAGLGESGTARILLQAANDLVDEIQSHQVLAAAEKGDLTVHPAVVDLAELGRRLLLTYREVGALSRKEVLGDFSPGSLIVETDSRLVRRIWVNMIRNALEASRSGERITIGCCGSGRKSAVELFVRNPAEIPAEVGGQIFDRFFSTKGKERGLGTYSMKLIGEHYLGGTISFTSEPGAGTTFRFCFPKVPRDSMALTSGD